MARTILVYGQKAYASELDLFRDAHVPASRATAIAVYGLAPAMVFRVRHNGGESFLPDLGDVCRITLNEPGANVDVIPVQGQRRRLAH